MLQSISKMEDGSAPPYPVSEFDLSQIQKWEKVGTSPKPERFYHTLDSWLEALKINMHIR